jgi:putative endonuclease
MAWLVPAIHETDSLLMPAYVYILSNRPNGTLYVGVSSDLVRRVAQHREGNIEGFTKQYGLKRLVYFEFTTTFGLRSSAKKT